MDPIVQEFHEKYDEAFRCWGEWYEERERDLRFYMGDQWSSEEIDYLRAEGRNTLTINDIKPTIDAISGKQRQSRLASVTLPQIPELQKVSDQFTKLIMAVMTQCDGYHTISDCFSGALKSGLNFACVYPDFSFDPQDGDIQIRRSPYNATICDPYFTKLDMSDCRYWIRRDWVSIDQLQALCPKAKIDELPSLAGGVDDKFTFMPQHRRPTGETLYAYDEYWKLVYRKAYRIVDMETGQVRTVDKLSNEAKEFLKSSDSFQCIPFQKKGVDLHIIVNGHHVQSVQDPRGLDEYPFVAFVANFIPESDNFSLRVQSQITQMRDPQIQYNRRNSQNVDIIESQMNSGWIYEDGALTDPMQLMRSGQNKVIKVESGRLPSLKRIEAANLNAGLFNLQGSFRDDIRRAGNVTEELMGDETAGRTAGVTVMARQGAGLVRQQDLFDNLRLSQKALTRKILKFIQAWSPTKIKQLIGEEPDPLFYNSDLAKYDIVLQEALLTDHQKQLRFAQYMELRQNGVMIPDEDMLEVATIQGAGELKERMAARAKAQEQQQQQLQMIEMKRLDSAEKGAQAKMIADLAMAKERESRAIANAGLEAERISEAVENRAKANLERAKAMHEIAELDDKRFFRYMQILQLMEDQQKDEQLQVRSQDIAIEQQSGESAPQVDSQQQIDEAGPMPSIQDEMGEGSLDSVANQMPQQNSADQNLDGA